MAKVISWFLIAIGVFTYPVSHSVQAQTIDSVYIKDFKNQLVTRAFVKQKSNELTISDSKNNRELHYKPNALTSLGFGGNYKWLGLDVAFKNKSSEKNPDEYGSTSSFDFQANLYLRRFAIDLYHVQYKGYYVENSADYVKSGENIINNNLKSGITGASAFYIFNHKKFSFRASHLHNEKQLKSAGSFIAGLYFSKSYLESDSSIVPKEFWDDFNEAALINKGEFSQIGLQFGYAHTFVLGSFYLNPAISLGLGAQKNVSYNAINGASNENGYFNSKFNTRIGLGYNSNRFQTGLQAVNDLYLLGGEEDTQLTYSVGSFRFFFAYRFTL